MDLFIAQKYLAQNFFFGNIFKSKQDYIINIFNDLTLSYIIWHEI